jgi:glycosyltransferase involved in cell wall biosynthesis
MNIGFEAKRFFHNNTGLGNYSRDLIRILSKQYPQNNYYLYNPKPTKNHALLVDGNVIEKNPTSIYKNFKNYWRQKAIIKDLVKDKIEIFHGLSGELPLKLKSKNIKSIVTIHDLIFVRYPELYSYFDRKIHFLKFKKATQNADLIIAISQQTKEDIISFLNIKAEKIKVIYQGCQEVFKKNYTAEEKEELREKFGLPQNFVLNVGTIEERKNALLIVKAIKDLNTTLVLVGKETKYTKQIHSFIKEYQLEKKVIFLKKLTSKELAIVYQLADIFIYPSVFEGFGIPIIEALYSKTPVITTNSGVFPEAGGPDSIYIDPTNKVELKEAITNLLENPEKRLEMTRKGFEFVQKFNDEIIAQQYMDSYLEVCST